MSIRSSRPRVAALALAVALIPVLASAQPPARGPMTFDGFDRNGDGVITSDEFSAVRSERMAARAEQGMPMRGVANAPAFADFDQDGDGQIAPQEFRDFQQQRRGMGPGMDPGGGMGPGMGPGMGRGMGMQMPEFAEFDTDGNGTLTKDEFYTARGKRMGERGAQGYPMRGAATAPTFEAIDADGDGRVGPEEFAAAQAQHHRQMMQGQPPQR